MEKNPVLIGNWQCTEWTREDKKDVPYLPSSWELDAEKIQFEFRADGTFTGKWGNKSEHAIWYTQHKQLFIRETGKQGITIEMIKTEPNHLEFEMSTDGKKETLKFKKIKS